MRKKDLNPVWVESFELPNVIKMPRSFLRCWTMMPMVLPIPSGGLRYHFWPFRSEINEKVVRAQGPGTTRGAALHQIERRLRAESSRAAPIEQTSARRAPSDRWREDALDAIESEERRDTRHDTRRRARRRAASAKSRSSGMYPRLAISAPRSSERPKLGHDLREIQSTVLRERNTSPRPQQTQN